jgi:hypothetical protein
MAKRTLTLANYQERAKLCRNLADSATHPAQRQSFLNMARVYEHMARDQLARELAQRQKLNRSN